MSISYKHYKNVLSVIRNKGVVNLYEYPKDRLRMYVENVPEGSILKYENGEILKTFRDGKWEDFETKIEE